MPSSDGYVAEWTGLSWSQVDGIQSRAVARGLSRRKMKAVQDHLWSVRSVSMDLWPAFIGSARKWLEDADSKICFDRFHVAGLFGKAVDQIRKRENRELKAEGNESLKGTKYDWLRNGNNLDGRSRRWFTKLTRENLKTARAWAIKETASRLWDYTSKIWAKKVWHRLIGWMWRSRLAPMVDLARSLKNTSMAY